MRLADISTLSFRVATESTSEMTVVGKNDGVARLEFYMRSQYIGYWSQYDGSRLVDSQCPPEVTTARYDIMQDRLKISVTSESVSRSVEFPAIDEQELQASHVLYVGAYQDTSYLAFVGELYSLQIYHGGMLAMNLIPVVLENGGCFFDTINEVFYKNVGTGDLIIGPRI